MGQPEPGITRDLFERFRKGDRDAFAALYRNFHRSVFRFVLQVTASRATATEITQDVFVWLVNHPGSYDSDRSELGTFLIGVARNFLRRQRRAENRWLPLEESSLRLAVAQTDDEPDTQGLRQAIQALPMRYREAVVLCELEGNTYDQASVILGVPIGTVRSRLHRARELLARKLNVRRETEKCSL